MGLYTLPAMCARTMPSRLASTHGPGGPHRNATANGHDVTCPKTKVSPSVPSHRPCHPPCLCHPLICHRLPPLVCATHLVLLSMPPPSFHHPLLSPSSVPPPRPCCPPHPCCCPCPSMLPSSSMPPSLSVRATRLIHPWRPPCRPCRPSSVSLPSFVPPSSSVLPPSSPKTHESYHSRTYVVTSINYAISHLNLLV